MYRIQLNHQFSIYILIELKNEKKKERKTNYFLLLRYSTVNLIVAPGGVEVVACNSIVLFIEKVFEQKIMSMLYKRIISI
jgi:hypothetical protein